MKSKTPLALMEQLIMVLVFALAAALCLRCFILSDRLSRNNALRDEAVAAAQTAAETLKSCGGDYERAAGLLDGAWDGEVVAVHTDEDFVLLISPVDSGELLLGEARVEAIANSDNRQLFELTVAWQEVDGHG